MRPLAFYKDVLGLKVTKQMNTAAFLAVGKYHHHICLNTWESLRRLEAPGSIIWPSAIRARKTSPMPTGVSTVRSTLWMKRPITEPRFPYT